MLEASGLPANPEVDAVQQQHAHLIHRCAADNAVLVTEPNKVPIRCDGVGMHDHDRRPSGRFDVNAVPTGGQDDAGS